MCMCKSLHIPILARSVDFPTIVENPHDNVLSPNRSIKMIVVGGMVISDQEIHSLITNTIHSELITILRTRS